jgi:hypothetical protein
LRKGSRLEVRELRLEEFDGNKKAPGFEPEAFVLLLKTEN